MLIYADGAALSRAVVAGPESAAWRALAAEREGDIVTSPLGLTELRRIVDPLGADVRESARELVDRIAIVRFSDQSLKSAAMASAVASPFTAIHVGIAAAHPDVGEVATYDVMLARLAIIHGLGVVSPGRPSRWWDK